MSTITPESSDRLVRAGRLLVQAGFHGNFNLVLLPGGGNSKTFRIDLVSGECLFFKEYFHHPEDTRDRLGTEFAFASFAWNHGLRTLARPYAMDREGHCALYAFLEGRKLQPQEISRDAVKQCLRFFQEVNACKGSAEATLLPAGSEACFCLEDHWQCLQRRVRRLETIVPQTRLDEQAVEFVRNNLAPICAKHLAEAHDRAVALGLAAHTPLSESDYCLSPSDFGFHNALQAPDGKLCFLDFEYAGWDDPAKTVCDFFCQPACPVPMDYYIDFAAPLAAATSDVALHRRRFDLLLPLYRLKWCCIMLNDFLPSGSSRRSFARYDLEETTRKTEQLHKARQALIRFRQSNLPAVV